VKPHCRIGLFELKLYHNVTDRQTDGQSRSFLLPRSGAAWIRFPVSDCHTMSTSHSEVTRHNVNVGLCRYIVCIGMTSQALRLSIAIAFWPLRSSHYACIRWKLSGRRPTLEFWKHLPWNWHIFRYFWRSGCGRIDVAVSWYRCPTKTVSSLEVTTTAMDLSAFRTRSSITTRFM